MRRSHTGNMLVERTCTLSGILTTKFSSPTISLIYRPLWNWAWNSAVMMCSISCDVLMGSHLMIKERTVECIFDHFVQIPSRGCMFNGSCYVEKG